MIKDIVLIILSLMIIWLLLLDNKYEFNTCNQYEVLYNINLVTKFSKENSIEI